MGSLLESQTKRLWIRIHVTPNLQKLMLETSHAKELSAAEHATIGASVGSIEMAIMRPAVPWQLPSSVD